MDMMMRFERALVPWLVQDYQQRTLRRAIQRAYVRFAKQHPQWVAALFDEHFVLTHLLPMLQDAAASGAPLTAQAVAYRWSCQFSMLPTARQQHMTRILPAATRFLSLVAEALAETEVGRVKPVLVEAHAAG